MVETFGHGHCWQEKRAHAACFTEINNKKCGG